MAIKQAGVIPFKGALRTLFEYKLIHHDAPPFAETIRIMHV